MNNTTTTTYYATYAEGIAAKIIRRERGRVRVMIYSNTPWGLEPLHVSTMTWANFREDYVAR